MGNSTIVPIEERVRVWVKLVPHLLAHLAIDHVALLSHSSGTIYLLNTLYHCREILHPERPYIALLGMLFHIENDPVAECLTDGSTLGRPCPLPRNFHATTPVRPR